MTSTKPSDSQFDQAEAEALLQQRYAEALADPNLLEHSEKLQSAWGNKVCCTALLLRQSNFTLNFVE
jgi:hypothetical protein